MASSGPIRQAIGPAKARLEKYLKEAQEKNYQIDKTLQDNEKIAKYEEFISTANLDFTKVENALAAVNKQDELWKELMAKMTDKTKISEEEETYNQTAGSLTGYLMLLDKGDDA